MASTSSSLRFESDSWPSVAFSDGGHSPLAARLAADMARRWRHGERPLAEDYLARHPELRDRPEDDVDLVYEEICLRQEAGEAAPVPGSPRKTPS